MSLRPNWATRQDLISKKKKKNQPAKIAQYLPRIHETGFDPKHCISLLRKLAYSPSTWETEADQELVVIL